METGNDWDIASAHPPTGELEEAAEQYDVVIIDSLQVYDPVNDEDSNSEANRQITPLVEMARQSKAAFLVTHNAGKVDSESLGSRFLARGASARVDRADIVCNFYEPPKAKEKGTRELRIVKSRHGYMDEIMTFRFEGDLNYTLVKGLDLRQSKLQVMIERVTTLMVDGEERSRQVMREVLGIQADTSEDKLLTRALKMLTSKPLDKLRHVKRGWYIRNSSEIKDLDKIPCSTGGQVSNAPPSPATRDKQPPAIPVRISQKATRGAAGRPWWASPAASRRSAR
jgi:AAA domain